MKRVAAFIEKDESAAKENSAFLTKWEVIYSSLVLYIYIIFGDTILLMVQFRKKRNGTEDGTGNFSGNV